MVGHTNMREQADLDFSRARRKAFTRRLLTRLKSGSGQDRLLCFEDARKRLGAPGVRIHRGLKTVPLANVVGSVGRCSEFDGVFLPNRANTGARWKAVDLVFRRTEELPPVSLYKVEDAYFVLDGNHGVSVARYHGVVWIDAEVTEFGVQQRSAPKRTETCAEQRTAEIPEGSHKGDAGGGRAGPQPPDGPPDRPAAPRPARRPTDSATLSRRSPGGER